MIWHPNSKRYVLAAALATAVVAAGRPVPAAAHDPGSGSAGATTVYSGPERYGYGSDTMRQDSDDDAAGTSGEVVVCGPDGQLYRGKAGDRDVSIGAKAGDDGTSVTSTVGRSGSSASTTVAAGGAVSSSITIGGSGASATAGSGSSATGSGVSVSASSGDGQTETSIHCR